MNLKKKIKTYGWQNGMRCNLLDDSGAIKQTGAHIDSDPLVFHGNGFPQVAVVIREANGAVPIDKISRHIVQLSLLEAA